jgi:hypothetical protein
VEDFHSRLINKLVVAEHYKLASSSAAPRIERGRDSVLAPFAIECGISRRLPSRLYRRLLPSPFRRIASSAQPSRMAATHEPMCCPL